MQNNMLKVSASISFLLLSTPFLFTSGSAGQVWTKTLCTIANKCPTKALLIADNFRVVGNRADLGFGGWQDSWAASGANKFASNILARKETAWPRISEGCTYPLPRKTPGYPIRVSAITKSSAKKRYITFNAQWTSRTSGPKPSWMKSYPSPRGRRLHGAYLWFNNPRDPSKWKPYPTPKWPFSLEVNVWNRVDGNGYRAGAKRFENYYDNDGKYEVRGHNVCYKGACFYAYYITLVSAKRSRNKVNININTLIRHLRYHTWNGKKPPALKSYYELIETSIAAEVKAPADAKFIANIATMGR